MTDLQIKLLVWFIFLLVGFIGGYITKDQFMKPDILTDVDVDLTVKKNRLFNTREKRKIYNIFRKKENKV